MNISIDSEPYAEAVLDIKGLKKDFRDFNILDGINNNIHIRYNKHDKISNTDIKQMTYCMIDWGSMIEALKDCYIQKEIHLKYSIARIDGFKVYKPKQLDVGFKFDFDENDKTLFVPFISQDLVKNTNFDIKNMLAKVVYIYTTEKGEILKWR